MEQAPDSRKPNVPSRDKRYFEIYWHAHGFPALNDRADALVATLRSVVQEIEVLKEMLRQKHAWDDRLYRQLRFRQMLSDHDSAGAAPWQYHAIYPYTLSEPDFLRSQLAASEEEIKAFQEKATDLETRT